MSHANAKIVFKDRTVLHGEYDGTSDIMLPNMFETYEEMTEMWRKQEWKKCECKNEPEKCLVYTDYGYGSSWFGTACRNCMIYNGPHDSDDFKDQKHYSEFEYYLINRAI